MCVHRKRVGYNSLSIEGPQPSASSVAGDIPTHAYAESKDEDEIRPARAPAQLPGRRPGVVVLRDAWTEVRVNQEAEIATFRRALRHQTSFLTAVLHRANVRLRTRVPGFRGII